MFKISSVMVAPALGLVLSLSIVSPVAFARSTAVQHTMAVRPHDGPSPIYDGNGNNDCGNTVWGSNDCGNNGNPIYGGFNGGNNGGGNGSPIYGGFNGGNNGGGNGSPIYGGFNGGGNNYGGFPGFTNWSNRNCQGNGCNVITTKRRQCSRITSTFLSHGKPKKFAYLSCRWLKKH